MEIIRSYFSSSNTISPKTEELTYFSDTKIKQIALYTLAGISVLGGGILSITSPKAGVPLVLAACIFSYTASSIIDYEDAETIAQIRREALTLSLPEIIHRHGWEKLIKHAILNQKDFDSAYRKHANTLSFAQIFSYYKKTRETLRNMGRSDAYTLPSPSEWKDRFGAETNAMSCAEILQAYSLAEIQEFQLVNPEQLKILAEAKNALEKAKQEESDLNADFIHKTHNERDSFDMLRAGAKAAYERLPCHAMLAHVDAVTKKALDFHDASARRLILQEEQSLDNFKARLTARKDKGQALGKEDLEEIAAREKVSKDMIYEIKKSRWEALRDLKELAKSWSLPLESSIDLAKSQLKVNLQEMQIRHDNFIKPFREETDRLLKENKATLLQRIEELTKAFRSAGEGKKWSLSQLRQIVS